MITIHVLPLWVVKPFVENEQPEEGALLAFW